MEVVHNLPGPNLDIVLHSPGGSSEAVEAIVSYLRSKYKHIRMIVPSLAMSAATMLACSADEILLGAHSSLGPTDPQFVLGTPLGQRMVPAPAILDQFKLAQDDCKDPSKLGAWLPMLGQFGPDLLVQCVEASDRGLTRRRKTSQSGCRTTATSRPMLAISPGRSCERMD